MMPETHKPGEIAEESGQYPLISRNGRDTGKEVTMVKGKRFPPTPRPGQRYGKPDVTKH